MCYNKLQLFTSLRWPVYFNWHIELELLCTSSYTKLKICFTTTNCVAESNTSESILMQLKTYWETYTTEETAKLCHWCWQKPLVAAIWYYLFALHLTLSRFKQVSDTDTVSIVLILWLSSTGCCLKGRTLLLKSQSGKGIKFHTVSQRREGRLGAESTLCGQTPTDAQGKLSTLSETHASLMEFHSSINLSHYNHEN